MTILRLAVGLGNPGSEYQSTRHNVGFEVIERVAKALSVRATRFRGRGDSGKTLGHVAEDEERGFALLEPSTFMNLSGTAVAAAKARYGLENGSILVICDDFHLALGRLRVRPKGSAGGHNGLKSIIGSLASEDFPRLRIGIGETQGAWERFVLSRFESEEKLTIHRALGAATQAAADWCLDGNLDKLMNSLNSIVDINDPSGASEVRKPKISGSPESQSRDSGPIQKNDNDKKKSL
jgi:PTH1 family peptidyl-tRNA hydrolase